MNKLIVIEGLDGSGKSTQVQMLSTYFLKSGINFKQIKLPDYDSASSTLVKMYLGGEFGNNAADVNAYAAGSFYAVDRYASYHLNWMNDYESGKLILADRYTTSNFIYQMAKLPNEQWDKYISWSSDFEYNKLGIPVPNLVIFLDMPIEISAKLLSDRYKGNENLKDVHESNVKFLEISRKSALYAAKKQDWIIVPCSDGSKPLSREEINKNIIKVINEKLC